MPTPARVLMYTRFCKLATFRVYANPLAGWWWHAVLAKYLFSRVCQLPPDCLCTRGFLHKSCSACTPILAHLFLYTRFNKVVTFRVYANPLAGWWWHAVLAKYLFSRVCQLPPGCLCTCDSARLPHFACMPTHSRLNNYTRFLQNSQFCVYSNPCQFSHVHAVLQACHISRVCPSQQDLSNTCDSTKLLHFACMPTPNSLYMYTRFHQSAAICVYSQLSQLFPIHAVLQACHISRAG